MTVEAAVSLRKPPNAAAISIAPAAVLVVGAMGIPLVFLVAVALQSSNAGVDAFHQVTLENFRRVLSDPFVWRVFARTFRVSALATGIAMACSYPVAWYLSRASHRARSLMFLLIMSPLLVSILARLQGWLILLGPGGVVPAVLQEIGFAVPPRGMIGTEAAIVVGLVHLVLPFGVLNLDVAFRNIDDTWILAARDLGATDSVLFWRVLFPLSIGGLIRAASAAMAVGVSIFATPALLGAGIRPVLSTLIYNQGLVSINWPAASLLAIVLVLGAMLLILGASWVVSMKYDVGWRKQ